MQQIIQLYKFFLSTVRAAEPAMLLAVRFAAAYIFFSSGLTKIEDMESTILLFEYEYAVPLLPPVVAAYVATAFELILPVFLVLGLGSRAVVIPLLVMTAVIQNIYPNLQHAWWAVILGTVLFVGPGAWSLDRVIARKYGAAQ